MLLESKVLAEYIKELSVKDTKNLTEKILKTTEEVGELAKKGLPYSGAYGTRHRFSDQVGILEETADIMLCVLSVAYDLGFSDEQITSMLYKKAQKWDEVQRKSDQVNDPLRIPFELHLTVSNVADTAHFRNACALASVKPIFLELEISGGEIPDVMTSSKHLGTNGSVMEEMEHISQILKNNGFHVTRKKVETVPWHPMAPQRMNDTMPPDCYFETHIGLAIKETELNRLREISEWSGAHLSRNAFKKLDTDTHIRMCTLRSYTKSREEFDADRDLFITALRKAGFNIVDTINEFAIYDTNTSHDSVWLAK